MLPQKWLLIVLVLVHVASRVVAKSHWELAYLPVGGAGAQIFIIALKTVISTPIPSARGHRSHIFIAQHLSSFLGFSICWDFIPQKLKDHIEGIEGI